MVLLSILRYDEFGPNDQRGDAAHFIVWLVADLSRFLYYVMMVLYFIALSTSDRSTGILEVVLY